MSVEFEEDNFSRRRYGSVERSGGMASWLIKHNVVKDESGANKVLIFVIIVCFAIAAYFSFF
jgi:hypothetical protein